LVISRLGSSDKVTIQNWLANPYAQLSEIVFGDGSHIATQAAASLAAAEGRYAALFPSFNPTTASTSPWSLQFYQAIAAGGAIAGLGQDFYGSAQGQTDLYAVGPTGQLATWTVSGSNVGSQNVALANSSGATSIVDPSGTVVGAGEDFFGAGQRDVFFRNASGQLTVMQISGVGVVGQAQPFFNGTQGYWIDPAATVVGAGEDFFGLGQRDVFERSAAGQLSTWQFSAAGVIDGNIPLTNGNGRYRDDRCWSRRGLLPPGPTRRIRASDDWPVGGLAVLKQRRDRRQHPADQRRRGRDDRYCDAGRGGR
jgi:hypothetical protein